jgi:membrane dipeptidase
MDAHAVTEPRGEPSTQPAAPWWIDGHLDLAYRHLMGPSIAQPAERPEAVSVSLPALRAARVRVALGTIFTEVGPEADPRWGYASHADLEGAHRAGVAQLEAYEALERAGEIRIVRDRADLEAAAAGGSVGIVLLMEGADPIRAPEEAAWWHARGLRVAGLAWSRGSRYAGGNAAGGPLTPAGRALVAEFDRLGVLHDASHLSDAAFAGLCAATRQRIVATHSNARSLVDPSERHLSDAQYSVIAARDGLVGLNLFGKFLASGRPATLDDALRHVAHAAARVGRDRVGLGSDFDGGFGPAECPPGCQRPEELPALLDGLAERGWSAEECRGFAHGNWLRVLRRALSGTAVDA